MEKEKSGRGSPAVVWWWMLFGGFALAGRRKKRNAHQMKEKGEDA